MLLLLLLINSKSIRTSQSKRVIHYLFILTKKTTTFQSNKTQFSIEERIH